MTWREWLNDLNWRESEHLRLNPPTVLKDPFVPIFLQKDKPAPFSKDEPNSFSVKVLESTSCPGAWCVFTGSQKINTFFGHDAHEKAMKLMKELLEKNQ